MKAAGVVAGGTEAGDEATLPEPGAAGLGEPSVPLQHKYTCHFTLLISHSTSTHSLFIININNLIHCDNKESFIMNTNSSYKTIQILFSNI